MTETERAPDPGQVWKCGDEFLPFHPQASHVPPEYRDGWNRCYRMAAARAAPALPPRWKAVPVEPTPDMKAAAMAVDHEGQDCEWLIFQDIFSAMLAAAPSLPSPAAVPAANERFTPQAGCTCAGPDGPCDGCVSNREAYAEWLAERRAAPAADRGVPTQRELDMAALIKRLARRLEPPDALRTQATEYLRREGLSGSPVRVADGGVPTLTDDALRNTLMEALNATMAKHGVTWHHWRNWPGTWTFADELLPAVRAALQGDAAKQEDAAEQRRSLLAGEWDWSKVAGTTGVETTDDCHAALIELLVAESAMREVIDPGKASRPLSEQVKATQVLDAAWQRAHAAIAGVKGPEHG